MLLATSMLVEQLNRIIGIDRSNIYSMNLTLKNYDDPEFIIDKIVVDKLRHKQLFNVNVTDDIQVTANLFPDDLLKIVNLQSNLYAEIVIEYVDRDTFDIILEEEPKIYRYGVFIHELEDISKRIGIQGLTQVNKGAEKDLTKGSHVSRTYPINFQLISETNYAVNKQMFNGLITDITMSKAIMYIASVLGIKKINMIPPHNTTQYKHIHIPPNMSSYKVIFDYLQTKFGIYDKGLSYYYTDEVLYLYPAYDTEIERPDKLKIVKVSPSTYSGLNNYHDLQGKVLTIVSNTDIEHTTMSNVAMENEGSNKVYASSDRMLDGQVDPKTMTISDTCLTISNNKSHSIVKNSAIPSYEEPTNNIFTKLSSLAMGNAEMITLGWNMARLYMLKPGTPIEYIYDGEDQVMMKSGILEAITYTTMLQLRKNDQFVYTTLATLMVRLSTDSEVYIA
jgi:hypothetical protein